MPSNRNIPSKALPLHSNKFYTDLFDMIMVHSKVEPQDTAISFTGDKAACWQSHSQLIVNTTSATLVPFPSFIFSINKKLYTTRYTC